jgi:hypothetical protein
MRRFLLYVFVSCTALAAAFSLFPDQLGRFLELFGQDTVVNRGMAVTVLAGLTVALLALRVRLWRSERDLARIRRDLARPAAVGYPPAPWGSPASWGSPVSWGPRPLR